MLVCCPKVSWLLSGINMLLASWLVCCLLVVMICVASICQSCLSVCLTQCLPVSSQSLSVFVCVAFSFSLGIQKIMGPLFLLEPNESLSLPTPFSFSLSFPALSLCLWAQWLALFSFFLNSFFIVHWIYLILYFGHSLTRTWFLLCRSKWHISFLCRLY